MTSTLGFGYTPSSRLSVTFLVETPITYISVFEAALGADTVAGVGDSPPYTYTFNTPFASSPSIALLTMAGVDGFNGGWAQVHGATLATTTSLFLSVDEDQILDTERDHTPEQVGYLVLAGPLVFPGCQDNADCSDGLFCNGAETCVAGACQAGGDPCPGQNCDEDLDTCFVCQVDAHCSDGLFCNGVETCVDDACLAGTPVDCDDGVGCTADSCNETSDSCDNVTNDALCDNGQFCDGSETCDVNNDCQAGTPVVCDDGIGCTADSCNEGTDSCDNVTNDAVCDDGAFCNGSETCSAVVGCEAGISGRLRRRRWLHG